MANAIVVSPSRLNAGAMVGFIPQRAGKSRTNDPTDQSPIAMNDFTSQAFDAGTAAIVSAVTSSFDP